MEDVMEQFKEAQIVREAQYASDMQQLRAELAMVKALYEEEKQKSETYFDQLAEVKLELTTALASEEIRSEQLNVQNEDYRTDLLELKAERTKHLEELDATRDQYLELERQAEYLEQEYDRVKAENAALSLNTKNEIDTIRDAVNGASKLLANETEYKIIVDTLIEANQLKAQPRDYILAKLARTAKELELEQQENKQMAEHQELLEKRVQRYENALKHSGASLQTPSVELLYDEINAKEEVIQQQEEERISLRDEIRQQQLVIQEQKTQIRKQEAVLAQYRANMREVTELRKVVRQMIKNEIQ